MDLPVDMTADTSSTAKWARRAVTVPGLVALTVVDLVALPVSLLVSVVLDLVRRSRSFPSVRFQLAVAFALGIHVVGLLLLLASWLGGAIRGRARERELDFRSELWWASATFRAARRLYRMRVSVEGEEALDTDGPIILMSRHASLLDVLLPLVFVSGHHRFVPRYVVKRELLWDPCVDLVGHRVPTAFVRRSGGREHELDVAAVESLARDLGSRDVVVLFPEGTRFAEEKRAHVLSALAEKDPVAFARAGRLKNLLPPHVGGPLTLLEHAGDADVVFCAHTGLEGARRLRELRAGSLLDATLRVRYWRVPAGEVPATREGRVEWLWGWWEQMDAWIELYRARPAALTRTRGGAPAGAIRARAGASRSTSSRT